MQNDKKPARRMDDTIKALAAITRQIERTVDSIPTKQSKLIALQFAEEKIAALRAVLAAEGK